MIKPIARAAETRDLIKMSIPTRSTSPCIIWPSTSCDDELGTGSTFLVDFRLCFFGGGSDAEGGETGRVVVGMKPLGSEYVLPDGFWKRVAFIGNGCRETPIG